MLAICRSDLCAALVVQIERDLRIAEFAVAATDDRTSNRHAEFVSRPCDRF